MSITIGTPAARARSNAGPSTTPSWNQIPGRRPSTAWSANSPADSEAPEDNVHDVDLERDVGQRGVALLTEHLRRRTGWIGTIRLPRCSNAAIRYAVLDGSPDSAHHRPYVGKAVEHQVDRRLLLPPRTHAPTVTRRSKHGTSVSSWSATFRPSSDQGRDPRCEARVTGDVAPPVPQGPVVSADHHLVVAPGVVVGAALGMRESAVQLDPGREGRAPRVGADPPAVELLPHLQLEPRETVRLQDVTAAPVLERRLDPRLALLERG